MEPMPILTFEIVGPIENEDLAHSLANTAGEILGAKQGTTWVKIHFLPTENYSESGNFAGEIQPVFVSVLLGQFYKNKEYAKVAQELSLAFSKIMGRAQENIHILFEPSAMGRIAFGGKLLSEN